MDIDIIKDKRIKEYLIEIINEAFDNWVRGEYKCKELSDRRFAYLSILRSLSKVKSGREFIQMINDSDEESITRSNYFNCLSEERRLLVFRQVSDALNKKMNHICKEKGVDYLKDFPELKDRVVVAGDGHAIEHASHSCRRNSGRFVPETSIHLINLHTGLGEHLTTVSGDGMHRHEMPALRKVLSGWCEKQQKQEKPPIVIYDLAGIDKLFWTKMALTKKNGIRVITKTKTSMRFSINADCIFDSTLPINKGVISYQLVGQDNAIAMHKVEYKNPEDGKRYEFLTTVDDLQPGLIAWLYLMRWNIEKMFDVFKNKMFEKKGWANGFVAQEIQARSCNTAYNFLQILKLIINTLIDDDSNDKLEKKRAKYLQKRKKTAEEKGGKLHPYQKISNHLYQLSQQFIRAVRNLFFSEKPIVDLLHIFRERLKFYL